MVPGTRIARNRAHVMDTSRNDDGLDAVVALIGLGAGWAMWQSVQRWRAQQVDLRGQVALVTGASRGLGYLLARELGREGCRLSICARDVEELERARMDLEDSGAEVLALPCDVAKQEQVERWVEETRRHYGSVDILVNNAGVIQVGPVHAQVVEDYETAMAIMYWGVVYPTMAVLPHMRARRSGRIVNITSIGGKISVPHLAPYSSAKFAAVGFSEGLRAELARDEITVTTIVPGLMRTGSHLNAFFKGGDWREFAMFAPMASLPVISMDAERAARQVVAAMKRGEAERTLGLLFNLAMRAHGVFPGLTADVLGIVNRFLPGANAQPTHYQQRGMDIQERLDSTLLETVTGWGISAARRFNQFPGPEGIPAHETNASKAA